VTNITNDITINFIAKPKTHILQFIIEGSCDVNTVLYYGTGSSSSFIVAGTLTSGQSIQHCEYTRYKIDRIATSNREIIEIMQNNVLQRTLLSSNITYENSISPCQNNIIKIICPDATGDCNNYWELTVIITFNGANVTGSCNKFLNINASNNLCANQPIQGIGNSIAYNTVANSTQIYHIIKGTDIGVSISNKINCDTCGMILIDYARDYWSYGKKTNDNFTMDKDIIIDITFNQDEIAVTMYADVAYMGDIEGGTTGLYNCGTSFNLTAKPTDDMIYKFDGWEINGNLLNGSGSTNGFVYNINGDNIDIIVNDNITIVALFSLI